MIRNKGIAVLAAGTALALGGCSFVNVQPEAEDILVLKEARVQDCERVGRTRVSVATKVGFIERGDRAIRGDLEVLARNSAADMGGDTVSPETPIEEGKQTFGVYDCIE